MGAPRSHRETASSFIAGKPRSYRTAWIVYACFTCMRDGGFMDDPVDNNKPPTFWQMLHSVMAAAFGVQSGKNRARDFTHGKPSHFVILGILFTAVFALTLFGIVKLVVHLAGI